MTEKWKKVIGFEGFYEVSSIGNVRSVARKIIRSNYVKQTFKGQTLSQNNVNGYLKVDLYVLGKRSSRKVHTLVTEAFIGPRLFNNEVRHLDGDKTNNVVDNLKYGTKSENAMDMREHGAAKYRPIVRSDGKRYNAIVMVENDGFSRSAVNFCCLGRTKTSGGFGWRYAS